MKIKNILPYVMILTTVMSIVTVDWDYWKEIGRAPYGQVAESGIGKRIQHVIKQPKNYLGLAGLAYVATKVADGLGSKVAGYGITAAAVLGWHLLEVPTWIKLRNKYFFLLKKQTSVSNPAIRNIWHNPLSPYKNQGFIDGAQIMEQFMQADVSKRKLMKQSFMIQMGVSDEKAALQKLSGAMLHLEHELHELRRYTNFQYIVAQAAGLESGPDELLSSDVLLQGYDNGGWNKELTDGSELDIASLGFAWSDKYSISYPTYYTWTYTIATKCVRLLLRHYSILKAIKTIMERVNSGEKIGPLNVYLAQ